MDVYVFAAVLVGTNIGFAAGFVLADWLRERHRYQRRLSALARLDTPSPSDGVLFTSAEPAAVLGAVLDVLAPRCPAGGDHTWSPMADHGDGLIYECIACWAQEYEAPDGTRTPLPVGRTS